MYFFYQSYMYIKKNDRLEWSIKKICGRKLISTRFGFVRTEVGRSSTVLTTLLFGRSSVIWQQKIAEKSMYDSQEKSEPIHPQALDIMNASF